MTVSAVRSQLRNLQSGLEKLAYPRCTGNERAGARQRYFRNMNLQEWAALYGRNYAYSADYIHANPKAFAPAVGHMARLGNRTEELAEIAFRYTGCFCRSMGSTVPGLMREPVGRPRFARQLRRQLKQIQWPIPDAMATPVAGSAQHTLPRDHDELSRCLTDALRRKKWLNWRGGLTRVLSAEDVNELLGQWSFDGWSDEARDAHVQSLLKALNASDCMQRMAQSNWQNKLGMFLGCAASALTFVVMYTAIKAAENSWATVWMAKMGMVASGLYLTAFLLRSATVLAARASKCHRGDPRLLNPGINRQYLGLFELAANGLRNTRNRILHRLLLGRGGGPGLRHKAAGALDDAAQLKAEDDFRRQAAYLCSEKDVPKLIRGVMGTSVVLNRISDTIFSFDRVVAQSLVSDPMKSWLFRHHAPLEHRQGISVGGRCTFTRSFKAAKNNAWGRARQSIASFIGHGGADCIGMGVGTAACSAAWTSMNVGSGGGMIALPTVLDGSAAIGYGFASVCAAGWGASLGAEVLGAGAYKVHQAIRGRSQQAGGYERLQTV